MKIDEKTLAREIRLYFKSNFDLICQFSQDHREISDMHPVSGLTVKPLDRIEFKPGTKVAEVTDFFAEFMNLKVTLRNIRGFVAYPEVTLQEAGKPELETTADSKSIAGQVKVILDIAQKPSYSDLDWIRKVLQNAAYKSKSFSDKQLLIEAVMTLYQKNDLIDAGIAFSLLELICKKEGDFSVAIEVVENQDFEDKQLLLLKLKAAVEKES